MYDPHLPKHIPGKPKIYTYISTFELRCRIECDKIRIVRFTSNIVGIISSFSIRNYILFFDAKMEMWSLFFLPTKTGQIGLTVFPQDTQYLKKENRKKKKTAKKKKQKKNNNNCIIVNSSKNLYQ